MCSSSPPQFPYKCPADIKWSSNSLIVTVFSKHLQPTKHACVHSAEGQGEKQQLLPAFLLELVYIPVLFTASIYICILDPSSLPEQTWPNPALVQKGGIALPSAQPRSFPPGRRTTCFLFPQYTRGSSALLVAVKTGAAALQPCWRAQAMVRAGGPCQAGILWPPTAPPELAPSPGASPPLAQAGRDAAAHTLPRAHHVSQGSPRPAAVGNHLGHSSFTCKRAWQCYSSSAFKLEHDTHRKIGVFSSWINCVGFSNENRPTMEGPQETVWLSAQQEPWLSFYWLLLRSNEAATERRL